MNTKEQTLGVDALTTDYNDGDWRAKALCRGMDTEQFYAERGTSHVYFKARCICYSCPVQQQCLDFAVDNSIYYGMWGGLAYRERLAYARGERSGRLTIMDIVRLSRKDFTVSAVAELLGITPEEVREEIRNTSKKKG